MNITTEHYNVINWARKLTARAGRGEAVSKPDLRRARELIAAHDRLGDEPRLANPHGADTRRQGPRMAPSAGAGCAVAGHIAGAQGSNEADQ
jgi:hypothetical protein